MFAYLQVATSILSYSHVIHFSNHSSIHALIAPTIAVGRNINTLGIAYNFSRVNNICAQARKRHCFRAVLCWRERVVNQTMNGSIHMRGDVDTAAAAGCNIPYMVIPNHNHVLHVHS